MNPDPYIAPAEDRKRGKLLAEWGRERTYAELLDRYFSLAPDVPPDLAKRWTDHKLADIEIARLYLLDTLAQRRSVSDGALLDVGCSSGGLLAAAHVRFQDACWGGRRSSLVGDRAVAVAGSGCPGATGVRERRASAVSRPSLPNRDIRGRTGACTRRPGRGQRSPPSLGLLARRPSALPTTATRRFLTRRSAFGEPAIFLARCRAGTPSGADRTSVRTGSSCGAAWELQRLFRQAGYQDIRVAAAGLHVPHVSNRVLHMVMKVYNRLRGLPGLRLLLTWLGPRLSVTAIRQQV